MIVMSDLRLMVQGEDSEDPPAPGRARLEFPVLSLQWGHVSIMGEDPSPDVFSHAAKPDLSQLVYLVLLLLQP